MEKCFCSCPIVCLALLSAFSVVEETGSSINSDPSTSVAVHKDYCEAESFHATCPSSQLLLIRHARYGRMRLGRCVFLDYGHIGCTADVLTHMDVMCSGNRSCEVRIPDATLDRANTCPKDLKTYLEVSYECVTVHSPDCSCDNESVVLPVRTSRSGFVSGRANGSDCRFSRPCVLLLKVPQGQRINISLWDFTLEEHERTQLRQQLHGVETCYRYGVIVEKSRGREVDVCGGWRRIRHVYMSFGNTLEIHLVGTLVKDHRPKFLLHYEVVGCTDFAAPANAWISRHNGISVDVNCYNGGLTYRVVCLHDEWVGSVGPCPEVSSGEAIKEVAFDETANAPGVFISVVVCLALVTGTTILIIGLMILHRQRTVFEVSRPSNQKSTNNWETHLTSTGDASAMSSAQEDCYNEVTYTPAVASPPPPGGTPLARPPTPCLCRTNNPSDTRVICGECVRPSIQLRQLGQRPGHRNSTEPVYCRGPDLAKALLIASPRCLGLKSPSDAESAAAAAAAVAPYVEYALNSPRFLQSEKSCAVLQDYATNSSSKIAPDL